MVGPNLRVVGTKEVEERLRATERGISRETFDAMRKASLVMERSVKQQITRQFRGGREWRASFTSHVFQSGKSVVGVVGSPHPAARIQETGGTIVPRRKKALTIPLTRKARRSRARDFAGAFIVQSRKGHAFIAQRSGGGLEFLYLLKDRVMLKASHYLTNAQKRAEPQVVALVGGRIAVVVGREGNA